MFDLIPGSLVAFVDLMMWPWMERLPTFEWTAPEIVPSESSFPKLNAWCQLMRQVPAVKACAFTKEDHQRFNLSNFVNDKPDYDFVLKR